jgi:hypothetical protein
VKNGTAFIHLSHRFVYYSQILSQQMWPYETGVCLENFILIGTILQWSETDWSHKTEDCYKGQLTVRTDLIVVICLFGLVAV